MLIDSQVLQIPHSIFASGAKRADVVNFIARAGQLVLSRRRAGVELRKVMSDFVRSLLLGKGGKAQGHSKDCGKKNAGSHD